MSSLSKGKRNIVLIGFMGTGKTTAGEIISEQLGYLFVDTDAEIEKKCGKSINEIFATKGEKYFRGVENGVVFNLSYYDKAVIACGGGIVKNADNILNLKKNGLVICLKADIDTVYDRVINSNERPLINGKSKEDIEWLMSERKHLYDIADVFIDTSNISPLTVANIIIQIFSVHSKSSEN